MLIVCSCRLNGGSTSNSIWGGGKSGGGDSGGGGGGGRSKLIRLSLPGSSKFSYTGITSGGSTISVSNESLKILQDSEII